MMTEGKTDKFGATFAEVKSRFPEYFSLRGFPEDVFRISDRDSYMGDNQQWVIYLEVDRHGSWLSFGKGVEMEIQAQVRDALMR